MKQINLKDKRKYCIQCKEIVEVVMKDREGFCPFCQLQLYSIDNRQNKKK